MAKMFKMLFKYMLIIFAALQLIIAAGCVEEKAPETFLKDIEAQETLNLIEQNQKNSDFVILDVRTTEEYASGHMENSINIDYYGENFRENLSNLDRNKTYLVFCKAGSRSAKAVAIMQELGFKRIYHFTGGISQWKDEGFPLSAESE